MSKKAIKNRRSFIAFLFFATLFIIALIYSSQKQKALKENHRFTVGLITSYTDAAKAFGGFLNYEFYVGQVKVTSSNRYNSINQRRSQVFVGKHFFVLYNPANPTNNHMLIFPEDFKRFGLTFPDSLQWVIQYQDGF